MVKRFAGFTLIELLIGISLVAVLATFAIPQMETLLNKYALKTKIAKLDSYVDQARNLAAITECPVQMSVKPANNGIDIQVTVQKNTFLKGCSAWYSKTTRRTQRVFTATINEVSVPNQVDFRFSAVSGVLDVQTATNLTLIYAGRSAQISYLGIGSGVVSYAN